MTKVPPSSLPTTTRTSGAVPANKTQQTPAPATTSKKSTAEVSTPVKLDGVDKIARSTTNKTLDRLWNDGQYSAIVDTITRALAPMRNADFKGLDGNALIAASSQLFVFEERLKATINKLSLTDDGKAMKLQALGTARDIAEISTRIFRQAVVLQDAADSQPVAAWLVAKDTHKNARKWSPEEHLQYVAQKTVEFYLKGGSESQISLVDSDFLKGLKSGALCEYVVDAYDVARASVVEAGKPSPGHT
ncbi:MAG TPA: hypothetical protein VGF99_16660, partial [Myxococcota bacterium]